jgi:hypothetical protein
VHTLLPDLPSLQLLGGHQVTLGNGESSELHGGQSQQSKVNRVQAEVDPSEGKDGLSDSLTGGCVTDGTGGAVVVGV